MEKNFVDYALGYAKMGWRVFPITPGQKKPPLIGEWQIQATTEENIILGWWDQWPNANIGIATGEKSGIFVLDIDLDTEKGKDGRIWLNRMIEQKGDLPQTPKSITGRGGLHLVFKYPKGQEICNSTSKLGSDVDIRGEGGYFVVAPSIHENGNKYAWDKDALPSKTPVADAPDWLLALIELVSKRHEAAPVNAVQAQPTGKAYAEGSRNGVLTSLAGSMQRKGMGFDAILAALRVENQTKCVPPLDDSEVEQIARSVSRYEPTAAPVMTDRDRAQAEWGFAKAVYLTTDYIKEFMWLPSSKFSIEKLGEFWQALMDGGEPVEMATKLGLLADLEKFTTDPFKADGYAKAISTYGDLDVARKYGGLLTQAANTGDVANVDKVVSEIAKKIQPTTGNSVSNISDVFERWEQAAREREAHPVDVWGIPYSPHNGKDRRDNQSWQVLSKATGGKHPGQLTILAGQPGVGKSWWVYQDILNTAIYSNTPVFLWSGEMSEDEIMGRMIAIITGVDDHKMRTGKMTGDDWQAVREAKALLLNSPLTISDKAGLSLHDLKAILYRQKMEKDIQQFAIDYNMLINVPGLDEIEKTAIISRDLKVICQELKLAGTLIASVAKTGMDGAAPLMAAMRGSGQQLHDADNIFFLTKFMPLANDEVAIRYPIEEENKRLATLHFIKGRNLSPSLVESCLHFGRFANSPAWREEPQTIDVTDLPFLGRH